MKNKQQNQSKFQTYLIEVNFLNLSKHLSHAFSFWDYDIELTFLTRIHRTATFVLSAFIAIFWPIQNITTNILICALTWTIISFIPTKLPRFLTITLLILSIIQLHDLIQSLVNNIALKF